jgi:ADP-heptose:LPS heptosyltransferase
MNAEYGARRSVPIEHLLQAFDPALHTLVNLQYLAPAEHLQAIRDHGFQLIDAVNAYDDVEGLAALAAQCDAIVSIDNSTLHLAGALGLKTFALLPRLPNWRWQLSTPHSVWYPSLELIRQAAAVDWSAEIAGLRLRLGHSAWLTAGR